MQHFLHNNKNNQWSQQSLPAPPNLASSDYFGTSLALLSNTLFVGAPGHGSVIKTGAVFVYNNFGNGWVYNQTLTPSDGTAFNYYGGSVASNGTCTVIGAYRADDGLPGHYLLGAAYVYTLTGNEYSESKLSSALSNNGDGFGNAVAITSDGYNIFVGKFGDSSIAGNAGSVSLFQFNNGMWVENQVFTEPTPTAGNNFGFSISGTDEFLLIGTLNSAGLAYVFTFQSAAATYSLDRAFVANDAANGDMYGYSVSQSVTYGTTQFFFGAIYSALDASTVSATGAVYAYILQYSSESAPDIYWGAIFGGAIGSVFICLISFNLIYSFCHKPSKKE